MTGCDLILVGGGLAGGLLAYRLARLRPELSIVILERGPLLGGNHTWCFHASDLTPQEHAWLAPFVVRRWDEYDVVFPARRRRIPIGYAMISSERFAAVLHGVPGIRVVCDTDVAELAPQAVTLRSGETLEASAVVDGRGFADRGALRLSYQAFFGLEVRLAKPHGLLRPVLMDATVPQLDGYRFVYVLPLGEDRLLVEDTYYTENGRLDPDRIRSRVEAYMAAKGWDVLEVLRQEQGSLPITLDGDFEAFWPAADAKVARIGVRAGLFHPTTGYSLPHAVRLADRVAALPSLAPDRLAACTRAFASAVWRSQRFDRILNRLLFLAGPADRRFQVIQRFYSMPEATIRRFYAGRLTLADKARLLVGKPPVPFFEAIRALPATRQSAW